MPNAKMLAELLFEELESAATPMTGGEFLEIVIRYVQVGERICHFEFSVDDIQRALGMMREMSLVKIKIKAKRKGKK